MALNKTLDYVNYHEDLTIRYAIDTPELLASPEKDDNWVVFLFINL